MPQQTREQKVVLQLLKEQPVESLESVNAGKLIELLSRHKLFPIAEDLLKHLNEPERSDLKQRIQYWSLKSLHLSSVLTEIFIEFGRNDIDALALKGPVLTHSLYGDVAKRNYGDLDILVKREEMWESVKVLKKLGFNLHYPRENLTGKQWEHYFSYKKEIGLAHNTQKSFIELHIGIYTHELLRKAEESMLLEESVEEIIYESPIKTLNHENTFLYLVYHGAYHLYNRLFWLRDVAEALKRWDLDHYSILDKAKELGIDRLLGVSLLLAKDFFDSDIPEAYGDYIKTNRTKLRHLSRICKKRIMGREKENAIDRIRRNHYFLLLKPGLKYRYTVFISLFHRWYIRKFLGGH